MSGQIQSIISFSNQLINYHPSSATAPSSAAARQRQPMCENCEKSLPNQIVFDKIESIIRMMQDEQIGLPVKTAKSFMSKIPSVFTGIDLIQWMMRNLKLEDQQEAIHLANLIASHGYIFPIEDHTLSIKNDCTFYRFQTPYLWPSKTNDPENTDYAVYLCKRTMQGKTRLELADYEAENLARLQKMFSRKWEFIFMQAESQAKVDKKRDKLERKVLDSQERAFWDVYRPVPGCVNTTELDIKKACRLSKSAKRCSECQKVGVTTTPAVAVAATTTVASAAIIMPSSSPSPTTTTTKTSSNTQQQQQQATTTTTEQLANSSIAPSPSSSPQPPPPTSGTATLTTKEREGKEKERQDEEQEQEEEEEQEEEAEIEQLEIKRQEIGRLLGPEEAQGQMMATTTTTTSSSCSDNSAGRPVNLDQPSGKRASGGNTAVAIAASSGEIGAASSGDGNIKEQPEHVSDEQTKANSQEKSPSSSSSTAVAAAATKQPQSQSQTQSQTQTQSQQKQQLKHHHHHHAHHHHHHHHHPHQHGHHHHHHHRQCPHHKLQQQQGSMKGEQQQLAIPAESIVTTSLVAATATATAAAAATTTTATTTATATASGSSEYHPETVREIDDNDINNNNNKRPRQHQVHVSAGGRRELKRGSVEQFMRSPSLQMSSSSGGSCSRRKSECNRMLSVAEVTTSTSASGSPSSSLAIDSRPSEGKTTATAAARDQSKQETFSRPASACCSLVSLDEKQPAATATSRDHNDNHQQQHRQQQSQRNSLTVGGRSATTITDQTMLSAPPDQLASSGGGGGGRGGPSRKGSVSMQVAGPGGSRSPLTSTRSVCATSSNSSGSNTAAAAAAATGGLTTVAVAVATAASSTGTGGTGAAVAVAADTAAVSALMNATADQRQNIGELERELLALKVRLDRRIGGVKMSKVTQSYLSYFKQWAEYDPFIAQPVPSNPWISDSTELWDSERQTKDVHGRRVRRWAFSLKELLNDPAGREQFHRFLEKEFSAENLKFWDAVQELKRVHSKDVARRVEAIWQEYLAQDANCPINIDSKSYETSKKNMAKNKNNRYIFDEAAGHVYQLMKNDSYPRYLRSEMYKDYKEASEKKRSNQVAFDVFKPQMLMKHKFNF